MPVHDCVATNKCNDPSVDDYASVTVDIHGFEPAQEGPAPVRGPPCAWLDWRVADLGRWATVLPNISGGPYHIKWTASDGASIGNRDNQIMGSAIIFNDTGLATTPDPTSGTVGVTLNDSANLTGATPTASGNITFNLYDDADCTAPANYTQIVPVNGPGIYSTSPGWVTDSAGDWSWTASYSGDPNIRPATAAPSRSLSVRLRLAW